MYIIFPGLACSLQNDLSRQRVLFPIRNHTLSALLSALILPLLPVELLFREIIFYLHSSLLGVPGPC